LKVYEVEQIEPAGRVAELRQHHGNFAAVLR